MTTFLHGDGTTCDGLKCAQCREEDAAVTIVTDRPSHLRAAEVEDMVRTRWHAYVEITDACALTIASYWQSPGAVGRAMAELASTGRVDRSALLWDISKSRAEATNDDDRQTLDMLATWALHGEGPS